MFPNTKETRLVSFLRMRNRLDKFDDISIICEYTTTTYQYTTPFGMNPNQSDNSVIKNILEVAPNYTDISLPENYKYLDTNKPSKGWSMEHGYNKSFTSKNRFGDPDYYPVPGAVNRGRPDVEVILKHTERDRNCNRLNYGFKVYINHPTDLPQSSLYYYSMMGDKVLSMALSLNHLSTAQGLRAYDPDIRQCYFPDERPLKYFSMYTANNCLIECLSNITFQWCGCVEFYMPHDNSSKICNVKTINCPMKVRQRMQRQELDNNMTCNCLPACNSVEYEAETLQTTFNMKRLLQSHVHRYNITNISETYEQDFSKLEMYFKRSRFLSMRRSEAFNLYDFLANCGGLLGLFLGFSILSFVEIFYFLSLRLCCTIKKDLDEEKAQNEPVTEICVDKY